MKITVTTRYSVIWRDGAVVTRQKPDLPDIKTTEPTKAPGVQPNANENRAA